MYIVQRVYLCKLLLRTHFGGPTNYPTGRHSIYLGTTTVANEWETIELTFDSKPDPSMSDGLTSLILLILTQTQMTLIILTIFTVLNLIISAYNYQ